MRMSVDDDDIRLVCWS